MFSEPFRQEIEVAHPVEHWEDHRFWPNGRGEIIHRCFQRIGFHAEEHEVIRCVDLASTDQLWRENRITMRADYPHAILTKLFRPGWTDEKGHVAPDLGKVAADRTGANDKDPHSHVECLGTR
jgi:hypothetical protein